jgi:L,D-transpeptidase catalytic domain
MKGTEGERKEIGGILMIVLIAILSVGIFIELGGFTLFAEEPEHVTFVPLKEVPITASTTSDVVLGEETPPPSSSAEESFKSGKYIQIKDSCNFAYQGECVRVRSGAGLSEPVVGKLRTGMVLAYETAEEVDGIKWYKIIFDEWLRYPERVSEDWYVAADFVEEVYDTQNAEASSTKKIVVDRGDQTLKAFDGEALFMEVVISTGLELTPTPRGEFTVFQKLPTRYMQGPLPYLKDQSYYDVPGVPWNLYFTEQGAVIHGAYWHNSFGTPYSHGCVNLPSDQAKKLYDWAHIGTTVVVRD